MDLILLFNVAEVNIFHILHVSYSLFTFRQEILLILLEPVIYKGFLIDKVHLTKVDFNFKYIVRGHGNQ